MTDSIDKKSNEKRDNLDVDLDAMLDEAESSLVPGNESQDDEDAIDRLLMNAGFDADDTLMQAQVSKNGYVEKDDVRHDELDDFLSFDDFGDDFGDDFNESAKVQQEAEVEIGESEQAVGNLSGTPQDDDDALDRLLMNVGFDTDDTAVPSDRKEDVGTLDDFSDFGDFNKLEIQQDEPQTAAIEAADKPVVADELDAFFGFDDGFDESDLIQEDNVKASAELAVPSEEQQAVDDENSIDSLLMEADSDAEDMSEKIPEKADESGDDTDLDDFSKQIEAQIAEAEALSAQGKEAQEDDFLLPDFDIEPEAVVEEPVNDFSDDEKTDEIGDDTDLDDFSKQIEAQIAEAEALSAQGTGQDDENNIDRLLMEAGFDTVDASEKTLEQTDEINDDTDFDDLFQLDEVSDDFSKQMDAQIAEAEALSAKGGQEDDFLLPDFDITADTEVSDDAKFPDMGIDDELAGAFGDTDFLNEDETVPDFGLETAELQSTDEEVVAAPNKKQVADTVAEDAVKLSPFGFEQEDIKKQLDEAENKLKKAKLFSYVALGFGAVAVSAAVGLGVMTYNAKTEVSKLTEVVSGLEANKAKTVANNPHEELNAVKDSVVQLNQQVDGFITELKVNPQFLVDLLSNKVPDIAAKQAMVSKAFETLQVKIGGLEGSAASEPSIAELSKTKVMPPKHIPDKEISTSKIEPVKTGVTHEPAPAPIKEDVVHEPTPTKEVVEHEHAPSKENVAHEPVAVKKDTEIAPTKERAMLEPAKVEVEPKIAPAKVDIAPKVAPAKVKPQAEAVIAKPVVSPKAVVKEEPVKIEKPTATGKWGVNLIAYKQEWYAKSKAAEFAGQGVFAEVIPVREKNTTVYRLRVGGFKSKAEASSNTARIKKALNLDSVWVSDN